MTVADTTQVQQATAIWSAPRMLLRLEGVALSVGALALYAYQGHNWWIFVLCLLLPDLSAAGYLINPRIGAYLYNLAHTTILPVGLAVVSILFHSELGVQVALIWLAHIGMDRAVGYGLKYPTAFKETHLGRV